MRRRGTARAARQCAIDEAYPAPGNFEVRQIKGLTKVLRENTTAIGPKANRLARSEPTEAARFGANGRSGPEERQRTRAAETAAGPVACCSRRNALDGRCTVFRAMRGELLLQSSAGQKIDPDIEVADVSEHGIQVLGGQDRSAQQKWV